MEATAKSVGKVDDARPVRLWWNSKLSLALALAAFTIVYLLNAWVCDDAFITFRCIDNLLRGHGLVWNVGERVQAFTHPLWLALNTVGIAVLHDPYVSVLAWSWLLSIGGVVALLAILRPFDWTVAFAFATLLFCRAFVDYTSSGLENPLVTLLCASTFWMVNTHPASSSGRRYALLLGLLTSALFLARPDAIVPLLPILVSESARTAIAKRSNALSLTVGLAPIVVWEVFSFLYFGSLVPNTALAKVAMGLGFSTRALHAWDCIAWTLHHDPVSVTVILAGMITGLLSGNYVVRLLAAGVALQLLYLVAIGGDYMGGRFLGTSVYLAIIGLTFFIRSPTAHPRRIVLAATLVCVGAVSQLLPIWSSRSREAISDTGIANERLFYYPDLGLLPVLKRGTWKSHRWLETGRFLKSHPGTYLFGAIGMAGYEAGPSVRLLDPFALTNPFLARLPARDGARLGHYERAFPPGYLESELTGRNQLRQPALAALYSDVNLVTRANPWTPGRFAAISRLMFHSPDEAKAAFDRNAVALPGIGSRDTSMLSCFGIPYGGAMILSPAMGPDGKAIVRILPDVSTH